MSAKALIVALALVSAACSDTAPSAEPATTAVSPSTATPDRSDVTSDDLPGDLPAVTAAWQTDWSRSTIDLEELLIGIFSSDPRDAIRPLDDPVFESVEAGAAWLGDREPGVSLRGESESRFYPLSILTRHEIVNDEIDGTPIAVTYCPLCNTAVTFDRRVDGQTYRFGVSGLLRNSDLVMWDNTTDSLWQQITGEGIVGAHAGSQLEIMASSIVAFSDFRSTFPEGRVLSRETGSGYPYGINPYEFYSSRGRPFGFFQGEPDARFPALERVVGVTADGIDRAYPFSVMESERVVNDTIGSLDVVVWWGGDTADALDSSSIANSKAVGTAIVFSPIVEGARLTFSVLGDSEFIDAETSSRWNLLGLAIDGPLQGASLDVIPHRNEFWFAWAAFFPDGEVYGS
jgi:hypothetical protein